MCQNPKIFLFLNVRYYLKKKSTLKTFIIIKRNLLTLKFKDIIYMFSSFLPILHIKKKYVAH
jgi:hypothetical protein